jgi:aryl-alcohol dehydrogenase (NADP+)
MRMRTLGGTGIKVSPYCLGAMMFGAWGNPDHAESIRIIHAALDGGINFVDTADVYSAGESEEIVGQALQGRRDEVVLATKAHSPMGQDVNMRGNSRRWIVREVENSLRRLRTDYIDLYQMHRPDPDTDIDETLSALSDLVRSGKVRAIGSSTFLASRLSRLSGWRRAAVMSGSAASNRPTRSWCAASRGRCCRHARSTAWASSPGARSPAAG